jgi:hypothetical protein
MFFYASLQMLKRPALKRVVATGPCFFRHGEGDPSLLMVETILTYRCSRFAWLSALAGQRYPFITISKLI